MYNQNDPRYRQTSVTQMMAGPQNWQGPSRGGYAPVQQGYYVGAGFNDFWKGTNWVMWLIVGFAVAVAIPGLVISAITYHQHGATSSTVTTLSQTLALSETNSAAYSSCIISCYDCALNTTSAGNDTNAEVGACITACGCCNEQGTCVATAHRTGATAACDPDDIGSVCDVNTEVDISCAFNATATACGTRGFDLTA